MRKFTKLFCTAFLLLAGGLSASAQVVEEEGEKVFATFESPSGITWDAENRTFEWSSQYGNQLHNIGLPNGNLTEYSQLVVDCTILEGDGYRFMFYATDKGTTAGGVTIVQASGKQVYNLADFNMEKTYLTNCSEICLSGWNASGKVKVNEVYLIKSVDPLAGYKKMLNDAIAKGEMQSDFAKTPDSWAVFLAKLEAAKAALDAADATVESLETATSELTQAIDNLTLVDGYSNLTDKIFLKYASVDEPGEGTPAYCSYDLCKASDLPYGDGNVGELNWADLTQYTKFVVTTAGDIKPRFCLNRLVAGGQQAATPEESKMLDINPNNDFTWSTEKYLTAENGVYTLDVAAIVADYGFARLHCIKKQGWGPGVIVTGMYLYKEPVITNIELKLSEGDIAAAIAAAKAEIENKGDKVGNITVYMSKDANCTVGSTITAPNNITIWGNNATLTVAEGMTAPIITLDGTEKFAMKNETEASDHKLIENVILTDVTIKGLQNAIVKDNQKTLLNYLVILDCNIEMPASSKNVIDFNGKGYVGNVSVTNSTIWAKDKNTGFFAQYGSRPKNINETLTQDFLFVNSTIVNIANGKNMCDLKQNGTAQNRYSLLNSIFVDCGKENQVVVGLNKGQPSANPTWDVDGNYFAWGGKCVNEQEASKAGEGIVKNSVDGLLTFTDAAAGDFNGTFELAEGAKAPERLGDPRWTITYVAPAEPAIPDGEYYVLNVAYDEPLLIADGEKVNEKGVRLAFAFENGAYTITGNDFFADKKWTVEPDEWGFTFTISTVIDGVKKYVAIDNNWLKNLILTEELEDDAYWAFMYPEYWESLNAAGEVLYALTEGETFTSGQVVEVMDENKEAVATIQYGEAGEDYADFKAAKADRQVEGFTAFTEGNGTNGNKAGGTFYTIVPKYNGVISAGIVLNGGKAFHLTVDGVQNPVFDGNTLTNKYYGTFSFNVEAGKSYKFWCDGSKLGFYGFDYAWGPDVEPITEVGLNDETVGIATVKFDTTNGAIYNLNGQKMSGTLKSGLYIVNGKKVMVK